ncbi:hypothetical protein HII36_25335 [Nonomuraea sp. NN258]|uniref:hypothetical protein n=1 Tax=Nonomuraea antri TaxID=2730852 RepID=UPI0015694DBA|nr:hypothetical protein [Nonomuraea antri]NRQ35123.1 hypothetical protein [Nonomuraea antri]
MSQTPEPPEAGDRLVASAPPGRPAETPSPATPAPVPPSPATPAPVPPPRPHRPARPARPAERQVSVRQRIVSALAYAVRLASRLAALVLVLHAVFAVFRANPANVWYQFVESLAARLSLGLSNLFQLADLRWTTLVNHALAAIVWLIIGSALASLIRRASP